MILWGGHYCAPNCQDFNTGSRYNPSTDTWIATSTTNAPDARYLHTAVWTGSEMIVWAGENFDIEIPTFSLDTPSAERRLN